MLWILTSDRNKLYEWKAMIFDSLENGNEIWSIGRKKSLPKLSDMWKQLTANTAPTSNSSQLKGVYHHFYNSSCSDFNRLRPSSSVLTSFFTLMCRFQHFHLSQHLCQRHNQDVLIVIDLQASRKCVLKLYVVHPSSRLRSGRRLSPAVIGWELGSPVHPVDPQNN